MINLKVESAVLSRSHLVMVLITILCLVIEHSPVLKLIKKLIYVLPANGLLLPDLTSVNLR